MQAEWETIEAFQGTSVIKERRESMSGKNAPDTLPLSDRAEESQVGAEIVRAEPLDALDELKVSFATCAKKPIKLFCVCHFSIFLRWPHRDPGWLQSDCRHTGTLPRKSAVLPGA